VDGDELVRQGQLVRDDAASVCAEARLQAAQLLARAAVV
jgi:hypothetical protein